MKFTKKGFTLLELIIVIIVIGIIVSVALPKYQTIVERARLTEARNMLGSMRRAQYRYWAQYNTYTSNIDNLDLGSPTISTFFTYEALNGGGAMGAIGRAWRNSNSLPPGWATYIVIINETGIVNASTANAIRLL